MTAGIRKLPFRHGAKPNLGFEMFRLGNGGPSSGYALGQLHYRL